MPKLVVISEEMNGRTFELTEEKETVGRVPGNTIMLEDNAISSSHAELSLKGDEYAVRDLNSTNGTRVNGQRVVEMRLTHGDTVSFAHLQLQYHGAPKGAPQPMPVLKKTVDLSTIPPGSSTRPAKFSNSSPFVKANPGKSKKILQITVLGLAAVAAILLILFIIKILGLSPK